MNVSTFPHCYKKLFHRQFPMPTFAAVIGWRLGAIKMGSPVKVRRYPRSCKGASSEWRVASSC
jgi:hypothetical protein